MRSRSIAIAVLLLAVLLPQQANAATEGASLNIPWAIGGLRIERDGPKRVHPGEWPTVPVASVRIWDARTAWLNIEPADDQWEFGRLDAFVAKAEANKVEHILMTLGGTPKWAAKQQRKTDAPWMGPGSASPPKNWDDWEEFVSKVAERYQGRIDAYEIWNEPNTITYWSGTNAEWAKLTDIASEQIKRIDPQAQIVIGAFAASTTATLNKIAPMLMRLNEKTQEQSSALSFHWYPARTQLFAGVKSIASTLRQALKSPTSSSAPLWITEMNVRNGANMSGPNQAIAMQSMTNSAKAAGIAQTWWYAWTDLGPKNLIQIYDGTPAARWLKSND